MNNEINYLEDGISDYEKYGRLFVAAMVGGDASAQKYLGHIFEVGAEGAPQDLKTAYTFYHMAASCGDQEAVQGLLRCFNGLVVNDKEAVDKEKFYNLLKEVNDKLGEKQREEGKKKDSHHK
ncbi:MAG: hypothetical protein LBG48_04585 [Rickettsiales bacterium]|jgi:TPR repeat protein|nr:hypothetical protein [Rickettsiales bacterium]